jgi:hypothetical protein
MDSDPLSLLSSDRPRPSNRQISRFHKARFSSRAATKESGAASSELLVGLRLSMPEVGRRREARGRRREAGGERPEARGRRREALGHKQIGELSVNAATASEIARLETLTITKMVEMFESLFSAKCRSRNKRDPIRRIAWQFQANAEGDLSERAKARASELAFDSEVPAPTHSKPLQFRTLGLQAHQALMAQHTQALERSRFTSRMAYDCSRQVFRKISGFRVFGLCQLTLSNTTLPQFVR